MNLRNKNILITGVGKGLGKSMVEYFLKSGAYIYGITRSKSDIKKFESNKKLKIFHDRGGIDEHVFKKMFNLSASQSYMNPFDNTSVASNSVSGDVEKVLMLPDTFDRYVLVEVWSGEPYLAEPYIDMLNTMLDKYYDLDITRNVYNGIHPKLTRCDILCYKVLGKK